MTSLPRLRTVSPLPVVVALIATAFAARAAAQAPPSPDNVIYACVATNGDGDEIGRVRIVGPDKPCRRHERKVAWNIVGPQGPQGIRGPQGEQGVQGPVGPVGPPPATGSISGQLESCDATARYLVYVPGHAFTAYADDKRRFTMDLVPPGVYPMTIESAGKKITDLTPTPVGDQPVDLGTIRLTDTSTDSKNCGACGIVCQTGAACMTGQCVMLPTCNDGIKNGLETGVDCGGGTCPQCGAYATCRVDADCLSGSCVAGTCAWAPLPDGSACTKPTDCSSQACIYGTCRTPTCNDGVQDGFETDVDCGGSQCPKCGDTKSCTVNADCSSNSCVNYQCVAVPGTCNGVTCSLPNAASTCYNNTCAVGACYRGWADCDGSAANGCETDIYNSAANCGACYKACAAGSSCQSGTCVVIPQ